MDIEPKHMDVVTALKLTSRFDWQQDDKGIYFVAEHLEANQDSELRALHAQAKVRCHEVHPPVSTGPHQSNRYELLDGYDVQKLTELAQPRVVEALNVLTADIGDGITWKQKDGVIFFEGSTFEVGGVHQFSEENGLGMHLYSHSGGSPMRCELQPGYEALKLVALATKGTHQDPEAMMRMLDALNTLAPEVTWKIHPSGSKIRGAAAMGSSAVFGVTQLLKPLIVPTETGDDKATFKIDAFTASDLQALEAKAADKTKSAICSGCPGCNSCKPTHAAVPVVSAVEPDLRGLKPGDQIRIPYPKQGYSL
jgi:hypothetical protein